MYLYFNNPLALLYHRYTPTLSRLIFNDYTETNPLPYTFTLVTFYPTLSGLLDTAVVCISLAVFVWRSLVVCDVLTARLKLQYLYEYSTLYIVVY